MTRHINTDFETRWGIHCKEFAEQEGLQHSETIRMRVKNFGTPYQRRSQPTKYERKYARTLYEIAEERGLHPSTVEVYERKHKDAWYYNAWNEKTKDQTVSARSVPHWRDQVQAGKYWAQQCTWLHPLHPDYDAWRAGELFPDEYVGGSSMTTQQVNTMMKQNGWNKY